MLLCPCPPCVWTQVWRRHLLRGWAWRTRCNSFRGKRWRRWCSSCSCSHRKAASRKYRGRCCDGPKSASVKVGSVMGCGPPRQCLSAPPPPKTLPGHPCDSWLMCMCVRAHVLVCICVCMCVCGRCRYPVVSAPVDMSGSSTSDLHLPSVAHGHPPVHPSPAHARVCDAHTTDFSAQAFCFICVTGAQSVPEYKAG